MPDAPGKKSVGFLWVAGFVRQRADGEADLTVVRSDELGDEVTFGRIGRGF